MSVSSSPRGERPGRAGVNQQIKSRRSGEELIVDDHDAQLTEYTREPGNGIGWGTLDPSWLGFRFPDIPAKPNRAERRAKARALRK